MYVDETGIDQYLYRPYGRALKGAPVYGKISGKKYKRTSIVAGQCDKKLWLRFSTAARWIAYYLGFDLRPCCCRLLKRAAILSWITLAFIRKKCYAR